MAAVYRHRQIGWVILASLVPVAVLLAILGVWGGVGMLALIDVVIVGVAVVFATLTIEVDAESLRFWFGPGLIRKRFPLGEIRAWRVVTNSWYAGWGIRLLPGAMLYNVSGLRAVELQLNDGRVVQVGSDEPEAVCRALVQVKGEPAAPAADDAAPPARHTRAAWIGAGILIVVLGGIGGMLLSQWQPPEVAIEDGALVVDTLFYGDRFPLRDVTALELRPSLPAFRTRTNGTALGSRLRGHFRVDELGPTRVFIDAAVPPFLLVRTARDNILVNLPDADATRRLHADLERAWHAAKP